MRCDIDAPTRALIERYLFQSLSGFLMRCDPETVIWRGLEYDVSIPIGFSDAL